MPTGPLNSSESDYAHSSMVPTTDERQARRSYRSPVRAARQAETRRAVLEAAQASFAAHGWAGTTISGIAAGAGVAAQTVYDAFGTKAGLLAAAMRAAAAPDTDGVVVGATWADDLRSIPTQEARWEALRAGTSAALEGTWSLATVMREALGADHRVAEHWDALEAERRHDVELVVDLLDEVGPLRLPAAEAVDVLMALTRSTDLYGSLRVAGWSPERAATAVSDVVQRTLLP